MLGEEYVRSRETLIELIRYTRALAKRSGTPLLEGEEALEDQLNKPFRFVLMGEPGSGKTSLIEQIVSADFSDLSMAADGVSLVRNTGYRVFDAQENACEKLYSMQCKGIEFVEVHNFQNLNEAQHAVLNYMLEGADMVLWVLSAENPWSAQTWASVEQKYPMVRMRSAIVLQQVDRRPSGDIDTLLSHISELSAKRAEASIPLFSVSAKTGAGISQCKEFIAQAFNRSVDRRRLLRTVYNQTYALLRRTEENIDERSRLLAGDQEYLQSIEAQIDRAREEQVRHVLAHFVEVSELLGGQIPAVMQQTKRLTNVLFSHVAIFGNGDTASKVERVLSEKVSQAAAIYASKEAARMCQQCRQQWQEMRPHLEQRLSIDVGDFNEESFDEQVEQFCEGLVKSVKQVVLHLKLRRFLDLLLMRQYAMMRKYVKLALFLIAMGTLLGSLADNPYSFVAMLLIGLGLALMLASAIYSHHTGVQTNDSFEESLEDAVPALRKALREDHIDRVRAFYNGYAPMFESMRRRISDAKVDLMPQQKVAGQLFLRLKSLEQEL